MNKEEHDQIQMLLCKVNKVTSPFRHTNSVPDRALVDLSNYQIEFEKWFNSQSIEKQSMLKDIDTFNPFQDVTKPQLKTDLSQPLVVDNCVENIVYKITSIIGKKDENGPNVGESIQIQYDFSPGEDGHYGWETLQIVIFREPENYIRQFKNIRSLEEFLYNFTFELDKKYAIKQIAALRLQIKKLESDYELV